jgi:hypothetical protein
VTINVRLTLDESLTCAIGGYKRRHYAKDKGWHDGNEYRRTHEQKQANDILAYFGEVYLARALGSRIWPAITGHGGPDVSHKGTDYEGKSTIGKSGHLLVPADTPDHWVCVLIIGLPPHGLHIAGWMTAAEAKTFPIRRRHYRAATHWVPQSALHDWRDLNARTQDRDSQMLDL